ncbi:S24 family peptidase [Sphingomonas sp.]|uniref:S24 family peptidase n=1 Tax=Sphingomonas sp. TaxID=28214 RepID=UPI003CC62629
MKPPAEPRAALRALAAAQGVSLLALSAMIGRNGNYLQQWVTRGSPRRLAEADRRRLADFFGVAETVLGGEAAPRSVWRVPRLDVAAAAGAGRVNDEAALLGFDAVPVELARALGLSEGQAAVIRVAGDSMAPGLCDGDRLLVDQTARTPDAKGGVYAVRIDGLLLVKRVRRGARRLLVTSDNPGALPVGRGEVEVVGRAVWQMRVPV